MSIVVNIQSRAAAKENQRSRTCVTGAPEGNSGLIRCSTSERGIRKVKRHGGSTHQILQVAAHCYGSRSCCERDTGTSHQPPQAWLPRRVPIPRGLGRFISAWGDFILS